jgi:glycosyltransferase involved in cell wall biosynthesis
MKPLLSIVIPCYNEKLTIIKIIKKINKQKINKEIIIVDDGSDDGTKELLKKINRRKYNINKILFKKKNSGKGSSIRVAQKFINGKYVIIQDADLEYDPQDYKKIIDKFKSNSSIQCVYGSRVMGAGKRIRPKKIIFIFTIFANKLLTLISNLLNSQNLTDAHTCYKAFRTDIFKKIKLERDGFDFCPEITSKISNIGIKIYEVPISYHARTYEDGKKIKLKDAFLALYTLIKNK